MASFSAPLVVSATPVRLPPTVRAGDGLGSPGHPISAIGALPPSREEGRARFARYYDPAGEEGNRTSRRDVKSLDPARWGDESDRTFDATGAGSIFFLVQVLSQDLGPATGPIARHRDGPVLASDAYRRAGGDPALYSEQPQLLRIAV